MAASKGEQPCDFNSIFDHTKNRWVFRQGDFSDNLYFLRRGRCQLMVKTDSIKGSVRGGATLGVGRLRGNHRSEQQLNTMATAARGGGEGNAESMDVSLSPPVDD